MLKPIEQIERRTLRYWYEDGLADLAAAWVFILVGLFFLVQVIFPSGPVTVLTAILLPVVVIAGGLMARRIVAGLKERWTYPRTGYVEYRRPKGSRRWRRMLIAAMMAIPATLFVRLGLPAPNWIPFFNGLIVGVALLYVAQRFGLARYAARRRPSQWWPARPVPSC